MVNYQKSCVFSRFSRKLCILALVALVWVLACTNTTVWADDPNYVNITATAGQQPTIINTSAGERLQLTCIGAGSAVLRAKKAVGSDLISETQSLTINDSKSKTAVVLVNLDNPGNITLDEVILTGPLYSLTVEGTVSNLKDGQGGKGKIKTLNVKHILNVDLPKFDIDTLEADSMGAAGGPSAPTSLFNAKSLKSIHISGDINKVLFFQTDAKNKYNVIDIKGVVRTTSFFGSSLNSITVHNDNGEDIALDDVQFYQMSQIKTITVSQGSVRNCRFLIQKSLGTLTLLHGNLTDSYVYVGDNRIGSLKMLAVYSDANRSDAASMGNIENCDIKVGKSAKMIRADGSIDSHTLITATGNLSSSISTISTGLDCAASISASKLKNVLVGVTRKGKRIPEDETYTGGDFTGSITTFKSFGTLNVTGLIANAQIRANGNSSIGKIYAEDGFDAVVVAGKKVGKICVGFIGGKTSNVANANADVSGSVTAGSLGSLLYTGTRNPEMPIPAKHGKVMKVVPKQH